MGSGQSACKNSDTARQAARENPSQLKSNDYMLYGVGAGGLLFAYDLYKGQPDILGPLALGVIVWIGPSIFECAKQGSGGVGLISCLAGDIGGDLLGPSGELFGGGALGTLGAVTKGQSGSATVLNGLQHLPFIGTFFCGFRAHDGDDERPADVGKAVRA